MKNLGKINCIGVIGDVHTEDKLLKLAVEFLKPKNVEKIFCVGDIADGKGDINQCCNILEQEKIVTVLGNHDRWLLTDQMRSLKDANSINNLSKQSQQFLNSNQANIDFITTDGLGLLCHGLDNNDMARVTPDDYGIFGVKIPEKLINILGKNLEGNRKFINTVISFYRGNFLNFPVYIGYF